MQTICWSLDNLLKGWVNMQQPPSSLSVTGLSIDSRTTQSGDLFFALKGLQQHGLQHSQQAIENGALAIAWESSDEIKSQHLPDGVPCIEISQLQDKLGFIGQRFYADVSKQMYVVGVTGTDGKTSVTHFIAQALHSLNLACGVIGTLGYGVYPKFDEASHTTPDAIKTHGLLHEYFADDAKHAVIEASSHGLVQGRLNGVNINTAVFTNLGRDHMDYHVSLEAYGEAKKLLFKSKNLQHAVINADDAFGQKLINEFSDQINVITYSIAECSSLSDAYLKASNIKYAAGKTSFEISSSWGDACVTTKLVGSFNVSNVLSALGALLANNIEFEQAVNAIQSVSTVPGRMEFVEHISSHVKHPAVVIDYAHTPQALENVLQVLRAHCTGTLYCVFGCGGDRDKGKRKLMANAVEQYADIAVLTDDNPRFEDPIAITDEVESGFSKNYSYVLIHDREAAIEYAINKAGQHDLVLIAGKGHEAVQIVKANKINFDDKKIAQEVLQKIS